VEVIDMGARRKIPGDRNIKGEELKKRKRSSSSSLRDQVSFNTENEVNPLLQLQTEMGNKTVRSLIERASTGLPVDKVFNPEIRAEMELKLNSSLENVHIHDDSAGKEVCQDTGAEALTFGKDIFLREPLAGKSSDELILHEFAHIAQQPEQVNSPERITSPEDSAEREALQAVQDMTGGHDVHLTEHPELASVMARVPDEEEGTTSTLSDEMQVTVYTWELNVYSALDQLILIMPSEEQEPAGGVATEVTSQAASVAGTGEWNEYCRGVRERLKEISEIIDFLLQTPGLMDLSKDIMTHVKDLITRAMKNSTFAPTKSTFRRLFRESMEGALDWSRTEDVFEISSQEVQRLLR